MSGWLRTGHAHGESVALVLLLFAWPAGAQNQEPEPEPEPVRVSYGAVAGCPQREHFLRQVFARTARARLAADGEVGRTFVVSVQQTEQEFFGTLTVADPSGSVSNREVKASGCDEVVSALALVAALTIDPQATTAPLPEDAAAVEQREEPSPAESSEAQAAAAAATPQPAQPAAPSAPPTPPPAAPVQPAAALTPTPPSPELQGWSSPYFAVGAQVELVAEVLPRWSPAPRAFAEYEFRNAGVFSPRVGVSVAGTFLAQAATDLGDAEFLWVSVRVEGCPVALRAGSALALRPCVAVDGNLLRGSGQDSAMLSETFQESVGWWAVSLPVSAELDVSERMRLRLQGGPTIPLDRAEFYFDDGENDVEIHRTDVGGFVGLGAGLRL